jgi:hypothetical protein
MSAALKSKVWKASLGFWATIVWRVLLGSAGHELCTGRGMADSGVVETTQGVTWSGEIHPVTGGLKVIPRDGKEQEVRLDQVVSLRFQRLEIPRVELQPAEERGWRGQYFAAENFEGPATVGTDAQLRFEWNSQLAAASNRAPASAFWQGSLVPLVTGVHQFALRSSGRASFWIQSQLVSSVDSTNGLRESIGEVALVAERRYPVTLQLHRQPPSGSLKLEWSASSLPRSAIPNERVVIRPSITGSNDILRGLLATYYANPDFSHPRLTRVDRAIDFNWRAASPAPEAGIGTRFSVTWTGSLSVPKTGEYRFAIEAEGGTRLFLDGRIIYEQWEDRPEQTYSIGTAPLLVEAGRPHSLRLDFFNEVSRAKVKLNFYREAFGDAPIFADGLRPSAAPDRSVPVPLDGAEGSPAASIPAAAGIWFNDGSMFSRAPLTASASEVTFVPGGVITKVPVASISRIHLADVQQDVVAKFDPNRTGAWLHNGDFLEGDFLGMDAKQVRLGSILFGNHVVDRDRVLAILIRAPIARARKWNLTLADGSRFFVEKLRIDSTGLAISDSLFGSLRVPWSVLSHLQADSGATPPPSAP